jgi:hypothetical protein
MMRMGKCNEFENCANNMDCFTLKSTLKKPTPYPQKNMEGTTPPELRVEAAFYSPIRDRKIPETWRQI